MELAATLVIAVKTTVVRLDVDNSPPIYMQLHGKQKKRRTKEDYLKIASDGNTIMGFIGNALQVIWYMRNFRLR